MKRHPHDHGSLQIKPNSSGSHNFDKNLYQKKVKHRKEERCVFCGQLVYPPLLKNYRKRKQEIEGALDRKFKEGMEFAIKTSRGSGELKKEG